MNEEKFEKYLSVTPSQKGVTPNKSRRDSLIKLLKQIIPDKLQDLGDASYKGNLLNIEDIDYLEKLKKRFNKNGDLQEWDQKENGKGGGSASLYQYINFLKSNKETPSVNSCTDTKNIILYGSPGVGKTHNVNKLIKHIEDGKSEKEIFDAIKANENSDRVDISDIKERVKFVTFHQSFGYEDFIEGFRPNKDKEIKLDDGIFKIICDDAQKELENVCIDNIDKYLDTIHELEFTTKEGKVIAKINSKKGYNLTNKHTLTRKNILKCVKLFDKLWREERREPEVSELKDLDITSTYEYSYKHFTKELFKKYKKRFAKNYYLIIDEINRGNISKIFGELITLIEEDKRDVLEVTLPYSKKPFRVPSNLYIIGTMNSTDKSIALIDIALRRRFTFLKMEPNADLIEYNEARVIFDELNKRIEKDLDKDYQLGHSYFMNIQNSEDLAFVLEYKIIPLLEEYYYGDKDRLKEVQDKIYDIAGFKSY